MSSSTATPKITWYGHAAFSIEVDGEVVLIDPWLGNPLSPDDVKEDNEARYKAVGDNVVAILITHGHFDHVGNTLEVAKHYKDAKVVCIHEISIYLKANGLDESQVVGCNKGGTVKIGNKQLTATMVEASHSGSCGSYGAEHLDVGGAAAGWVLNCHPTTARIYHAGDTGPFGDMAIVSELYGATTALMPIGGHYTADPRGAAFCLSRYLQKTVKLVVPMHYGTFPALAGTPDELKSFIAKDGEFPCGDELAVGVMKPGESRDAV